MSDVRIFLSYSHHDATDLAKRLRGDLVALGYDVWQDTQQIPAGMKWHRVIEEAIRRADVMLALLTPQAVRSQGSPGADPDTTDGTCLDELSMARYGQPPTPIVPIMAISCEPPLYLFRLDYIRMTEWATDESQYQDGLERIVQGIEAALRGEPPPYRRWHRQLPVLDFTDYLEQKRVGFVGRQWLFDEIHEWQRVNSQERMLLIAGDPGTGKTAFVAQFTHQFPEAVLAYHCCRAERFDTLDPALFVQSVAAMLASKLPAYAEHLDTSGAQSVFYSKELQRTPLGVLEDGILKALAQIPAPESVRYVLVDALDEALSWGGAPTIVDLLAQCAERLPPWMRLVATSRRTTEVQSRLSGIRVIDLDAAATTADLEAYISQHLQSPALAEQLVRSRQSAAQALRHLSDAADGNFLYTKQLLLDIERQTYSFDQTNQFPKGLASYYDASFRRRFPRDVEYLAVRGLLEVLVAAKEPLTEQELAAASGLDPDYGLPAALDALGEFLSRQNAHQRERSWETKKEVPRFYYWKGERFELPRGFMRTDEKHYIGISLFHLSIVDWFTSSLAHRFRVSRTIGQRHLAQMCWLEYRRGLHRMSLYSFLFLLSHLREAGLWSQYCTAISDEQFVISLLKSGFYEEFRRELRAALLDSTAQVKHLEHLKSACFFLYRHAWSDPRGTFEDRPPLIHQALALVVGAAQKNPRITSWLVDLFKIVREGPILPKYMEVLDFHNQMYYVLLTGVCATGIKLLKDSGFEVDFELQEWYNELGGDKEAGWTYP